MKIDKEIKLGIIIAILLAASASVFYYFTFTLPRLKRVAQEAKRQSEEKKIRELQISKKKDSLDACFKDAFSLYEAARVDSCKSLGLEKDCKLPFQTEKIIADYFDRLRDKCLKEYPTD